MKATSVLLLSTVSVWLALPSSSLALVIHVPGDQPTIQQGINVAQTGDMVLVAPGTYSGANNQNLDFLGKDIAVVSEAGPQSTIINPDGGSRGFNLHTNETQDALIEGFTIQNGGAGGIFLVLASATIRNCVFSGNSTSGLEIRGVDANGGPFPFVTLENCLFTGNSTCGLRFVSASGRMSDCQFTANNGWGILLDIGFWGSGTPQAFDRCTISANTAGGVRMTFQGAPIFTDCLISDHPAGSGRGVSDSSEHGRTRFLRCTFRHNLSGAYGIGPGDHIGAYFEDCTFEENVADNGGALYLGTSSIAAPDIKRCRFINNSATGDGGAIALEYGNVVIEDTIFWNNQAGQTGGAIGVRFGGPVNTTLRSCTIADGGAPVGAGIAMSFGFTLDRTIIAFTGPGAAVNCIQIPQVTCTDIFGNAGGDWVGCMAGLNGINGNIAADPRFCELTVGNLNLADNSPCAPEHSGTCGLIGALPVACGVTAVEPVTWGRVKAQYER